MKMSVLHFKGEYTVSWSIHSYKGFFPVEAKSGLYLNNDIFFTIFSEEFLCLDLVLTNYRKYYILANKREK